jgi:hypothetical protein
LAGPLVCPSLVGVLPRPPDPHPSLFIFPGSDWSVLLGTDHHLPPHAPPPPPPAFADFASLCRAPPPPPPGAAWESGAAPRHAKGMHHPVGRTKGWGSRGPCQAEVTGAGASCGTGGTCLLA